MNAIRFVSFDPRPTGLDLTGHTRHEVLWSEDPSMHVGTEENVGTPAIGFTFLEEERVSLPLDYSPEPVAWLSGQVSISRGNDQPSASGIHDRWSLCVAPGLLRDPGQIRGRHGEATHVRPNCLAWDIPAHGGDIQIPYGLRIALGDWLDRTFHRPKSSIDRLLATSEELVVHLRAALDQRDELMRRLTEALGGKQHAEDRIRVLEVQVASLETQLLEATAAVASGKPELVSQSKASLMAMASVVISLLALVSSVAGPFLSDWLANDDTEAIVEAQNRTTAAIEAMDDPDPIELSVDAALRCVVDVDDK